MSTKTTGTKVPKCYATKLRVYSGVDHITRRNEVEVYCDFNKLNEYLTWWVNYYLSNEKYREALKWLGKIKPGKSAWIDTGDYCIELTPMSEDEVREFEMLTEV